MFVILYEYKNCVYDVLRSYNALQWIHLLFSDVLHTDKQNADAIFVRGVCLYYQDNIDRAFTHFQQVLRLAPDHAKALDIYKVQTLYPTIVGTIPRPFYAAKNIYACYVYILQMYHLRETKSEGNSTEAFSRGKSKDWNFLDNRQLI